MGLPSSGPISGSQISTELGTSSTNISLGGMADSASFTAPDAYSDFYGFSNLTSYLGSALQSGTKFICTATRDVTYYHDGSNASPVFGDIIYTNSGGTTTLGAGNHRNTNGSYIETDSSGVVTGVFICI